MSPSGRWVFKESQRAGGAGSYYSVLLMVEDSRRVLSSRGRGRPGLWAATSPSLWDAVSDFVFYRSSFSMDGAVQSKEKSFPKTTVGWRWWEEEVGFFSLLILEDQATEHEGGSQGSPRTRPRPMIDGERHESSWFPGGSGQFPGWSGNISLHVWQCGGLWSPWKC